MSSAGMLIHNLVMCSLPMRSSNRSTDIPTMIRDRCERYAHCTIADTRGAPWRKLCTFGNADAGSIAPTNNAPAATNSAGMQIIALSCVSPFGGRQI